MMYRCRTDNITKPSISKKKQFDILIVDDEEDASFMFKTILEARGHNVMTLKEGVSCISKCKSNAYDIIFMDYHIADIDGVQVTEFIKDIYKTNAIIFAYTGDTSKEAIAEFKNIGMIGALIKPIDCDLLDNIMNTLEDRGCVDKNIFSKLARKSDGSFIVF